MGSWLGNVVMCLYFQLCLCILKSSYAKINLAFGASHVIWMPLFSKLWKLSLSHSSLSQLATHSSRQLDCSHSLTHSYCLRHFTIYYFRHAAENGSQQKHIHSSYEISIFTIFRYTKLYMDNNIISLLQRHTFSQQADEYFAAI